jgi:hypothetical protein
MGIVVVFGFAGFGVCVSVQKTYCCIEVPQSFRYEKMSYFCAHQA